MGRVMSRAVAPSWCMTLTQSPLRRNISMAKRRKKAARKATKRKTAKKAGRRKRRAKKA